jgi:hypothetical protein
MYTILHLTDVLDDEPLDIVVVQALGFLEVEFHVKRHLNLKDHLLESLVQHLVRLLDQGFLCLRYIRWVLVVQVSEFLHSVPKKLMELLSDFLVLNQIQYQSLLGHVRNNCLLGLVDLHPLVDFVTFFLANVLEVFVLLRG